MSRPGDWSVVGLAGDPTPGEAWGVREVASVYGRTVSAVAEVGSLVSAVRSASGTGIWHGQSGDAFRELLEDFPSQIEACRDSYATARDAMNWWAGRVEDHQGSADRGLEQARAADQDLQAARVALNSALAGADSSASAAQRIERDAVRYSGGVGAPTPSQVAAARRAVAQAQVAQASAGRAVQDAQSRLDVASRLVAQAAEAYEADAATAVSRVGQASDEALAENSLWEKVYRSDAWSVLVKIATVVVVVAVVAAFVLSGPIAAIVGVIALVAGVLLAVNDVMAWRAGDQSGWLALASVVLTVIPGGVLLKAGKGALSLTLRAGLQLAPKATTATVAALRAAARVGSVAALRVTRITEPWVARVNARLPGGSALAGPRGYSGGQLATQTAGDGPVVFRIRADWSDTQVREAVEHLDIANSARLDGSLSSAGRVSTKGRLRKQADNAITVERDRAAAAGPPYGPGEVAGHGPDTTWTGQPEPPYWQRQSMSVNSSFGAQAGNNYPEGFRPTGFQAVLPDGRIVSGSLDLES